MPGKETVLSDNYVIIDTWDLGLTALTLLFRSPGTFKVAIAQQMQAQLHACFKVKATGGASDGW